MNRQRVTGTELQSGVKLLELKPFQPGRPNRYLCKQWRSRWNGLSGSALFAVLSLILHCNPIWGSGHVLIQRWKSPLQKHRNESVNFVLWISILDTGPVSYNYLVHVVVPQFICRSWIINILTWKHCDETKNQFHYTESQTTENH